MDAETRNRAPVLALAAIVVGAFVVYAFLSTLVSVPRVHPDEVRYMIGASSLVEGDGLSLRGERIRENLVAPSSCT